MVSGSFTSIVRSTVSAVHTPFCDTTEYHTDCDSSFVLYTGFVVPASGISVGAPPRHGRLYQFQISGSAQPGVYNNVASSPGQKNCGSVGSMMSVPGEALSL